MTIKSNISLGGKKSNATSKESPTVLESNPVAEDDFDLWEQNQSMHHGTFQRWGRRGWCKPSCIPITIILTLIVLVVLLPLVEHEKMSSNFKGKKSLPLCSDQCRIQLIESIPDGLTYPADSPKFTSTFEAWKTLIAVTKKRLDIGSFYWTMRREDVANHSSAYQGELIFNQLLEAGISKKFKIRIAQSIPTRSNPNVDTEILVRKKAALVRSVDFPRLFGAGVLHTKVWISDETHFYVGSANMDWRSLTQVKELGLLVTNCSCLAADIQKIFQVYWDMGVDNAHIPSEWPKEYSTKINSTTPINVEFNNAFNQTVFISSSPPPMSPRGRTDDIDSILHVIRHAERFIHISVMDYFPLTIYTPKVKYWPMIDDALRSAAIENKVSVKLLISWWKHSRAAEDYFLKSLASLSNAYPNVDIEVKRFIVNATDDQKSIPFARVNHNKYMVTDHHAYIGTSNWSGDYFINTAGIGFIAEDTPHSNSSKSTIRADLASVFERDWNSPYAVNLRELIH